MAHAVVDSSRSHPVALTTEGSGVRRYLDDYTKAEYTAVAVGFVLGTGDSAQ